MKFCMDIVFCIDSTLSMKPMFDEAKKQVVRFPDNLIVAMPPHAKIVDEVRVKIISFRNFQVDGDMALSESPFYLLPAEKQEFSNSIHSIPATGGSNLLSSGLEALALAIRAAWTNKGDKQRHIITLLTDKGSAPFDVASNKSLRYPSGMPTNFAEITSWWENRMSLRSKRLILFAPDVSPWTEISNHWNNTIHYVSSAGTGLEENDEDYHAVLSAMF